MGKGLATWMLALVTSIQSIFPRSTELVDNIYNATDAYIHYEGDNQHLSLLKYPQPGRVWLFTAATSTRKNGYVIDYDHLQDIFLFLFLQPCILFILTILR